MPDSGEVYWPDCGPCCPADRELQAWPALSGTVRQLRGCMYFPLLYTQKSTAKHVHSDL